MLQDSELQALLTRTRLTRLASSVAAEDTAALWRERLLQNRTAFFAYLHKLGVSKIGERLAIANALLKAAREDAPPPTPPEQGTSSRSVIMPLERLEALRSTHFAEDLPIEPRMTTWTDTQAEAFFASGGLERPVMPPSAPPAAPAAALRRGFLTTMEAADVTKRSAKPASSLPDAAYLPTASYALLDDDDEEDSTSSPPAPPLPTSAWSPPPLPSSGTASSIGSSSLVGGLSAALAHHTALSMAAAQKEALARAMAVTDDDCMMRSQTVAGEGTQEAGLLLMMARELCLERDDGEGLANHAVSLLLAVTPARAEELLARLESEGRVGEWDAAIGARRVIHSFTRARPRAEPAPPAGSAAPLAATCMAYGPPPPPPLVASKLEAATVGATPYSVEGGECSQRSPSVGVRPARSAMTPPSEAQLRRRHEAQVQWTASLAKHDHNGRKSSAAAGQVGGALPREGAEEVGPSAASALRTFLAKAGLSHLAHVLSGETVSGWLARLESDRPAFLGRLQRLGVKRLAERQAIANGLSRAKRDGTLTPAKSEALLTRGALPPPAELVDEACSMLECVRARAGLSHTTRAALLNEFRLGEYTAIFNEDTLDGVQLLASMEPARLADALRDLGMSTANVKALRQHLFPSPPQRSTPQSPQASPHERLATCTCCACKAATEADAFEATPVTASDLATDGGDQGHTDVVAAAATAVAAAAVAAVVASAAASAARERQQRLREARATGRHAAAARLEQVEADHTARRAARLDARARLAVARGKLRRVRADERAVRHDLELCEAAAMEASWVRSSLRTLQLARLPSTGTVSVSIQVGIRQRDAPTGSLSGSARGWLARPCATCQVAIRPHLPARPVRVCLDLRAIGAPAHLLHRIHSHDASFPPPPPPTPTPPARDCSRVTWQQGAREERRERRQRAEAERVATSAHRAALVAELRADRAYKHAITTPRLRQKMDAVAAAMAAAAQAMMEARMAPTGDGTSIYQLPSGALARKGDEAVDGCLLRIRLPRTGSVVEACATASATVGELLDFIATAVGTASAKAKHAAVVRSANGDGPIAGAAAAIAADGAATAASGDDSEDSGVASATEAFSRTYAVTCNSEELLDDSSQPTLRDAGLCGRCALVVRLREALSPQRGDLATMPDAWRPAHTRTSPPLLLVPPQLTPHGLDNFLSELHEHVGRAGAPAVPMCSLALPGERLVGSLHGSYTFEDGPFSRRGILVVVTEPEAHDGGESARELLAGLQPLLHFQSLGFVLPERQANGGRARPETWAEDICEILRFLHDSQTSLEVTGLVGHGRAGEACVLYAERRTAELAAVDAAEAAAAASGAPSPMTTALDQTLCACHCGHAVTWHATHCCRLCEVQPGRHGPKCECRPATPRPRRYEVRRLCLLNSTYEDADGVPLSAKEALAGGWRMFSVHGTADTVAEPLAAHVFHSLHRSTGRHQLRMLANVHHDIGKYVNLAASVVNDWLEGARRLTSIDVGASLPLVTCASGGEMGSGDVPLLLLAVGATHVDLSGTRPGSTMLGSSGVVLMCEQLRGDTSIQSLDLSSNNIRAGGAGALATALVANRTLRSLELAHNCLLGSGAKTLAAVFHGGASLTRLGLRANGVGAGGAAALATALQAQGCSLTSLNLRENNLMACGAASLAAALTTNTSLLSLDLSENLLKEAGAAALAEALTRNTALTSLSLQYNGVRTAASALADALAGSGARRGALLTLDVRHNEIGPAEASSFAAALVTNTALLVLELGLDAAALAAAAQDVVAIGEALIRNRDRAAEAAADAAAVERAGWEWSPSPSNFERHTT